MLFFQNNGNKELHYILRFLDIKITSTMRKVHTALRQMNKKKINCFTDHQFAPSK